MRVSARTPSPYTSVILNFIRWASAVVVLLEHARDDFFVPYSQVEHPTLVLRLFYLTTALGHQALILFFVLSGFFIGSSVLKALASNGWSWRTYLINRLSRIYVVLVPAILLTAVLDHLGVALGGHPAEAGRMSLWTGFMNLLMLQGVIATTFGSNDPLWSLSYEFWYYILFPVATLALVKKSFVQRVLYFLAAVGVIVFIGPKISIYFIVWLVGVGLASVSNGWLSTRVTPSILGVSLVGLLLAIVGARWTEHLGFVSDLGLALIFSVFCYIALEFGSRKPIIGQSSVVHATLADFSYTLYLTHFPILKLGTILLSLAGFHKFTLTILTAAGFIFMCVLVIGICWIISLATERQTTKLRQFLFMSVSGASHETTRAKTG